MNKKKNFTVVERETKNDKKRALDRLTIFITCHFICLRTADVNHIIDCKYRRVK